MKLFSVAGDRIAILLDGAATQQQYAVVEIRVPPEAGPPPHRHHREDETFLVLQGEITVYLDGQPIVLHAGQSAFGPRGIPHTFKNTGSTEATLLVTASPAGVEAFFETCGQPLPSRDTPAPPLTPESVARLLETAPAFGIDILAP